MGASVTLTSPVHAGAAGQAVVGGSLGLGQALQLFFVQGAERALGDDLALEAGSPPGAGLLQGQAGAR